MRDDLDALNFGQLVGEKRELEGRQDVLLEEIGYIEKHLATLKGAHLEVLEALGEVRREMAKKNVKRL